MRGLLKGMSPEVRRAQGLTGGMFSIAARVALKEGVTFTARLDYPEREIRMHVNSWKQLRRLYGPRKEPETVQYLGAHLKPGETFYDIGANVGAFSFIAWALTEGKSTIYAFEPGYATYAALCDNVFLNNCSGAIIPLPFALAAVSALESFHYSSLGAGEAFHALGASGDARHHRWSQTVPAYRLDDMIATFHLKPPQHIKIDVDGAEAAVVAGAEATLRSPELRSLLVEIDEGLDIAGAVGRAIENAGFRRVLRHPKNTRFGASPSANYIFERT
ncbi:MAG: FkbM family methyltransferase [Patescibacteria group bacterium]|nr:FkbM family methyltransferase [Patescibacteria group bacterium]